MALRGKKKLPEKRGFVDGPGGYRGLGGYQDGSDGGLGEGPAKGDTGKDDGGKNDNGKNDTSNNKVSPGQSMAMLGTPALAGLSQSEADDALGGIARAGYLGYGEDNEPVVFGEDKQTVTTPGVLANMMDSISKKTDPTEAPGFMDTIGSALSAMSPASLGLGIMGALAGIPGLGFMASMFGQNEDSPSVFGTGVPNAGELNDTQEIGDTFSMPAPSGIRGFLSNPFGMNNPSVDPLGMPTPIGTGTDTDSAMRDFNDRVAAQNEANKGFSIADLFGPSNVPPDRSGPDPIIIPPFINDPTIQDNPFTGYGSINPLADYSYLYGGGFANGGLIPPESGPMSSGIGTLYKNK